MQPASAEGTDLTPMKRIADRLAPHQSVIVQDELTTLNHAASSETGFKYTRSEWNHLGNIELLQQRCFTNPSLLPIVPPLVPTSQRLNSASSALSSFSRECRLFK
jgi:hypothetical protein